MRIFMHLFLSAHFNCMTVFINLYFSPIMQRFYVTMTEYSSYLYLVSVFVPLQCRLRVPTNACYAKCCV